MPTLDANLEIDARPTKAFFIQNLIRDVELKQAISDLVDNAVDGARRLRKERRYRGLAVRIKFTRTSFEIADNCGGIDLEIARKSALRFGRPDKLPAGAAVKKSIGQFGIGMKRAMFKMGRHSRLISRSAKHEFAVTIDLDDWEKRPDRDWSFSFEPGSVRPVKDILKKRGTTIRVTKVHPNISDELDAPLFQYQLIAELEAAHQYALAKGLAISVNDHDLVGEPFVLLASRAGRSNGQLRVGSDSWQEKNGVHVSLFVSIAEERRSNRAKAGWNVSCNGRLVLRADKSTATGWGSGDISAYHFQYARFRGFALFESDDPGLLPWNTSKTGVDVDNPTYRKARGRMIDLMGPVLRYLDQYKEKVPTAALKNYLESRRVAAQPIADLPRSSSFQGPQLKVKPAPVSDLVQILYERPRRKVALVKELTGARTEQAVGERTFDFFLQVRGKR